MPLRFSPKTLAGLIAAFLLVVAVVVRPGGSVETASSRIADVAAKTTAAPPAPARTRAPAHRPWFAADGESPPPAPTYRAPIAVPPGDPQPIYLDPPPQGPDFPPTQ